MASFQKSKKRDGSIAWRAQLFVNGIRQSKSFASKAEAKIWAAATEADILSNPNPSLSSHSSARTVEDIFERYAREVSINKVGCRWEQIRLRKISKSPLAKVPLSDLGPQHIAQWRDERLKVVSSSTVRREMALISHALEIARREWAWLNTMNPSKDVRKPSDAPHRKQRINPTELQALLDALGYRIGTHPTNKTHEVGIALLLCLETACRSGEVLGLKRENIHLEHSYIHLLTTKNGSPRDVPLSPAAKNLIQLMLDLPNSGDGRLFNVQPATKDVLFRRAKVKAGLEHINFHDSRRESITRLAAIFSPLELAKVVGHKRLDQLLTYYEKPATELAEKLNLPQPAKDQP